MTSLPVGENDDARPHTPDHARNFQAIDPRVLDTSIRDLKCSPPFHAQEPRSFIGFTLAISGRAARAHLALGEVENSRTLTLLGHLQQRTAAGLFHIVTVSSNSEDIELSRFVRARS